ncbi:MAG: hypothetical protein H0U70_01705 [Tatlockia sp.]|nr:hypothetical protein [Tatlockia sp.]
MAGPKVTNSLHAFSSKSKLAWFEKYKNSSNFTGSLSSASSLDDYNKSRIKSSNDFVDIKAPDGKTLTEKLKQAKSTQELADVAIINDVLANAFKSEPFEKERRSFKAKQDELGKLLSAKKPAFSPGEVATYLLQTRSEVSEAVKNQYELAKANLNQSFDNNTQFTDALKRTLNCGDAHLETTKQDMLAALEKNNNDGLAKFEKAIGDNAKQLTQAETDRFHRYVFFEDRLKRKRVMSNEIIKKSNANNEEGASVEFNSENGEAIFKNLKVQDLETFETIQEGLIAAFNRPIKKNDDGSFSMTLNRIYQSDNSIHSDAAAFTQPLVASGNKKITFKINNKDPVRAAEHARLFLEGAVLAGANPKDITIHVNGEVKHKYDDKGVFEKNELFKEYPERLQYAQAKADSMAGLVTKAIEGSDSKTQEIKAKLQELIPPDEDAVQGLDANENPNNLVI